MASTTWLNELIDMAADFIVSYCRLSRYPELAAGYTTSGASPSTDLTGLSSTGIYVTVNGAGPYAVAITLANCDSGANTAAEFQSVIRAIDADGFDEVTVVYTTVYTVTSGRFGEGSSVVFSILDEDHKHVAQATKLTANYGAVNTPGATADGTIDSALCHLVQARYQQTGAEHASAATFEGGGGFTAYDLPPFARAMLDSKRRLW